jgi:hypothetical protein
MEIEVNQYNRPLSTCNMKPGTNIRYNDLPIGYFPLIYVNAIFHKGMLVSPWNGKIPAEKKTMDRVRLNFARENLTIFKRLDIDKTNKLNIISVQSNRLENLEIANTYCIGVKVDDDPYAVIFTCAEFLRFYYCTSSVMANAIFDGRIHSIETDMFDGVNSYKTSDGHVFITLRKQMLDCDAKQIALYFSDRDIALKTAQDISLKAAKDSGEFRNLIAYPPFVEEAELEYVFIPFEVAGKKRQIVTRIISSFHKAKFTSMVFDREMNHQVTPRDDRQENIGSSVKEVGEQAPNPENNLMLEDGTFFSFEMENEIQQLELGKRFPEIEKLPCRKIPPKLVDPSERAKQLKIIKKQLKGFSTARGSGVDQQLGGITIHGDYLDQNISIETNSVDINIGNIEYRRTINLLKKIAHLEIATVEFMENILDRFKIIDGIYFNAYSIKTNDQDKRFNFHLIDKATKTARLVLITKLIYNNRTRFLIDFQQKIPQEVSYQVFFFDGEQVPENAIARIKEALKLYSQTKISTGKAYINLDDIHWGWFKHKNAHEPDANWLVNKVFTAVRKNGAFLKL